MVDSRKRGKGKQADLEEEEEAEYSDKVKQKKRRQEKTDEQKEQDAELAERAKAQGTSLLSRYVTKYARKDDCPCGDGGHTETVRWAGVLSGDVRDGQKERPRPTGCQLSFTEMQQQILIGNSDVYKHKTGVKVPIRRYRC